MNLDTLMSSATVVMVARNGKNRALLAELLTRDGHETVGTDDPSILNRIGSGEIQADLVLVDLSGFNRAIWQQIDVLKASHLPFVVILPRADRVVQRESYARGAVAVLVKPLVPADLLDLIANLLDGRGQG